MRLLFVHADRLEFEAVTPAGEDLAETDAPMEGRMADCVVVFATVEREDEADPRAVVENAAAEVRDVAHRLNTRRVVLYPSAHLSDDPAAPDGAEAVLRDLGTELDGEFEVLRAPFGWYATVDIAAKGHPLSELSRRVTPERSRSDGADAEPASEWRLVFPGGEIRDPVAAMDDDSLNVSDDLQTVVEHEVEGEHSDAADQPPHVELLREQALASYDDRGKAASFRWYPRGKLVRDSLAEYVRGLAVEYGAMPVEMTNRAGNADLDSRAGQLSFMADLDLSEADLPLRLYDPASCSLQRDQRDEGERRDGSADLTRERPSATHQIHTAARDMEQAKDELRAQAELARRTGDDLGLNYAPVVRTTREFHDGNEPWVESLVETLDAPALLEVLPERRDDWAMKVDFSAVDGLDRPVEVATVRLDVEGAQRLGIEYSTGGDWDADDADEGEDGSEEKEGDGEETEDERTRHPPVVRCSPAGDVERVLAVLLDRAAGQAPPGLPTWLSPTQVRFVPVGEDHVEFCDGLADDLEAAGVRADVDDRDETVGERLATAGADWVPYYAVVGDREMEGGGDRELDAEGGRLKVNVRGERAEREMDIETLREAVLGDVDDLPKTNRYLPKRVSRHPDFAGR